MGFILLKNINKESKNKRKGQMSLEMIIGLIILLVVAAVVIKIFMDKMNLGPAPGEEAMELDPYMLVCDKLCQDYIDSRDTSDAFEYCRHFFPEIDLNKNSNIEGDVGTINGFGVCEDRVYCFALTNCKIGTSRSTTLTPEKCKDVMCKVYKEQYGSNESAASVVQGHMPFGVSCDPNDDTLQEIDEATGEIILDAAGDPIYKSQWWKNTFENVHCR
ncbi:MAG: hypothetical protein U9Q92_00305 [archaeon]|nr:hypothetical protein [archaeon]